MGFVSRLARAVRSRLRGTGEGGGSGRVHAASDVRRAFAREALRLEPAAADELLQRRLSHLSAHVEEALVPVSSGARALVLVLDAAVEHIPERAAEPLWTAAAARHAGNVYAFADRRSLAQVERALERLERDPAAD